MVLAAAAAMVAGAIAVPVVAQAAQDDPADDAALQQMLGEATRACTPAPPEPRGSTTGAAPLRPGSSSSSPVHETDVKVGKRSYGGR
jgi:hypothetical protein